MNNTDTDISIADNISEIATVPVHAADAAPATITIDRSKLLACTRRPGEPYIFDIVLDLELPEGVVVEDVFVGAEQRDLILQSLYPDFAVEYGEGYVTVQGLRLSEWAGPKLCQERDCELEQHFDAMEFVLTAVAKPGACVVLSPRWLRGVTYRCERGWANAGSLRELFNFWSLHQELHATLASEVFGLELERDIGDDEFGWESSECTLIFRWISAADALEAGLASHALIACDVSFADDALERLLGVEQSFEAHEAVNKSADAMRRMLGVIDRGVDNSSRTTYVGGLLEPMTFFGLDR